MKTISQVSKLFKANKISPSHIFEVDAQTIDRIYTSHQRTLDELNKYRAIVASKELEIDKLNTRLELYKDKERIIYG